jgi:hypothetical protein
LKIRKNYSLIFASIDFDILKINKMQTAQNEATIPIKAVTLSLENKLLKSSCVMLKTINAKAKKTNI